MNRRECIASALALAVAGSSEVFAASQSTVRGVKIGLITGSLKPFPKMPGKDELRATYLMTLLAVPTEFVRMLAAGPTNFLYALQAREAQLNGK